jgi:hypothetical protein
MAANNLVLPLGVVSRIDVLRLLREIEAVDEFLRQAQIREPGTSVKMPKTSRMLDDVINTNKLNILLEEDRKHSLTFIMQIKDKAPVLHISFSADPSPLFTQKIIYWLRRQIHPLALMDTGLRPNIGAGCIVRTNNRYFDFSLHKHFSDQKQLLIQSLEAAGGSEK